MVEVQNLKEGDIVWTDFYFNGNSLFALDMEQCAVVKVTKHQVVLQKVGALMASYQRVNFSDSSRMGRVFASKRDGLKHREALIRESIANHKKRIEDLEDEILEIRKELE